MELSSAGKCDSSEISWTLASIKEFNLGGDLVAGWNHIILPLETAKADDRESLGAFDISKINFFRLFMVNPEGGADIVVKIDNMRLDNSGIARKQEQAKVDKELADAVIELINKIGADVDLASENVIKRAENAFAKLTDAQKALVTNKEAMEQARAALEALKAEADKDDVSGEKPGTDTETPDTDDKTPDTDDQTPDGDTSAESGCASALTVGASALMLLAAAWVTMTARKKED